MTNYPSIRAFNSLSLHDDYGLVTIVIGTYNQEKYIRRAIESALNQTYSNLQIIINNNGSADNTANVLSDYSDNNIIAIVNYEENNFLTKVENDSINLAVGKYICFFSGDDYYMPTYIEDHVKVLSSLTRDYGVVYSNHYSVNEYSGEFQLVSGFSDSGYILDNLILSQTTSYISPNTPLMRTEVMKEIRPNTSIFSEGEGRYVRIAIKYKFKFINKPSVVMAHHNSNQGKNYKANSKMFYATSLRLIKKIPEKKNLINSVVSKMFINNAWISIRTMSDREWAKECIKIALKHSYHINIKLIFVIILAHSNDATVKYFNNFIQLLFRRDKNHNSVKFIEYDYPDY